MADLDGLFASLSASFDARLERDEERAADDLAFSLLQDRRLGDVVARAGCRVVMPDGRLLQVASVGVDFLRATAGDAEALVPLHAAVIVGDDEADGPTGSPTTESDDLLGRLRTWARRGSFVEVTTAAGVHCGTLAAARPDHVLLRRRVAWAAVAYGRILAIGHITSSLRPEG